MPPEEVRNLFASSLYFNLPNSNDSKQVGCTEGSPNLVNSSHRALTWCIVSDITQSSLAPFLSPMIPRALLASVTIRFLPILLPFHFIHSFYSMLSLLLCRAETTSVLRLWRLTLLPASCFHCLLLPLSLLRVKHATLAPIFSLPTQATAEISQAFSAPMR